MIDASLRRHVIERAGDRCEYCQLSQEHELFGTFHIEHIIAKQHGGDDLETNLCLACSSCNLHKGPNVAGVDAQSGDLVPLFHPRNHRWSDHFEWHGAVLAAKTAIGRVTIIVLGINLPENLEHRESLIAEGVFPGVKIP